MKDIVSYAPLWKTLAEKKMTTYTLREKFKMSASTVYRLKRDEHVKTTTLDDLCNFLDCEMEDIIKHVKEE